MDFGSFVEHLPPTPVIQVVRMFRYMDYLIEVLRQFAELLMADATPRMDNDLLDSVQVTADLLRLLNRAVRCFRWILQRKPKRRRAPRHRTDG